MTVNSQGQLDNGDLKSRTATDINVNSDNIDYATGGATATCSKAGDNCIATQLTHYFSALGTQASVEPTTKVIFWIGGNDFLHNSAAVASEPTKLAQATFSSLKKDIVTIKDKETAAGHYDIYVINLSQIGNIPTFNGNAAARTAFNVVATDYNKLLSTLPTALNDSTHTIQLIDVNNLLNNIDASPQKYGFNPADANHNFPACTVTALKDNKCEGYIFWDSVHPTAAVHALIAKQIETGIFYPDQASK